MDPFERALSRLLSADDSEDPEKRFRHDTARALNAIVDAINARSLPTGVMLDFESLSKADAKRMIADLRSHLNKKGYAIPRAFMRPNGYWKQRTVLEMAVARSSENDKPLPAHFFRLEQNAVDVDDIE